MDTTTKIRDRAIIEHNISTDYFKNEYKKMMESYFSSAFAYGRKKLELLLDDIVRNLAQNSTVLDIGCGTGEQVKRYRKFGFNAVGIEPAENMRLIAQKYNPGVPILDGIITNLPFQNESFDFILAIEVLRYLHPLDIQQAYKEMLRVLKPEGKLVFTMVNRYALDGFFLYDTLKKMFFKFTGTKESVHCEFVTPKQIQRDLNSLGIKEIEFYGRMFAPFRLFYKINEGFGAWISKRLDSFADNFSQKKILLPFSGHLVVSAIRPQKLIFSNGGQK